MLDKSVIVVEDQIDISMLVANKLKKILEKRFVINLISKHGNKSIPVNFCNKSCNICQPIVKIHLEHENIKNSEIPITTQTFQSVNMGSACSNIPNVVFTSTCINHTDDHCTLEP